MLIPLSQLQAHPHNANVMPEALLAKLAEHIRRSGLYPPLIVRPVGTPAGHRFEILDGHHRALALQRLGHEQAQCEVWPGIDDRQAAILLLTLNRLRGEDDPHLRGELLARAARDLPPADLARLVPDDLQRIERLMALAAKPCERLPEPDELAQPLQSITFFFDGEAHRLVLQRLREIDRADRGRALLKALGIAPDGEGASPGAQEHAATSEKGAA